MSFGQYKIFINYRRRVCVDYILFFGSATMCFCQFCVSKNVACNVNPNISKKYAECVRHSRICKLVSNVDKFNRVFREQEKLHDQLLASEAKNIRLRKLLRANREKLRKFDNREDRNIEELEKLERELKEQKKTTAPDPPAERLPVISDLELGQWLAEFETSQQVIGS